MGDRYKDNGVVYFNNPLEVDYLDWLSKHLDCDRIIMNETSDSDMVHVICYADTSSSNENLRKLRGKMYPNSKILQELSSEEVNYID